MHRNCHFVVAIIIAGSLLFSAIPAIAQTIVHSFDGDNGPGLAVCESGVTHCDRPDMDVAANGKQVVQVTWQNIRVYDYSGHLLRSTPMSTLIRNAGLDPVPTPRKGQPAPAGPNNRGPYEPHVVYDEFIGRWIITVSCLNDCLLVSASSDAMGSWGGVYPSCLQSGSCLNFDPAIHIGYDKNGVYYCAFHGGDDNPNTIPGGAYDCFGIPPPEVKAIAQGTVPAHLNRTHNMPLDVIPAIDHNRSKSASAPVFFLSKTCERLTMGGCQNSTNFPFQWVVDSFTWNGANGVTGTYDAGGSEQPVKTGIGSTENKWLYSFPCCGPTATIPQAGNDAIGIRAAESHRLANLVQFGTHLQAVMGSGPCTKDCGSQGADTGNVMIWVDMDCSKATACVVSQTAKISGPNFNPEFGSVGVDAAGNVGIMAISSTASTDMSLLLWTHRKSDPPNTFSGPTTVIAGTQPWSCLNAKNMANISNPVGVLTKLDPVDGTKLWTTQQWSNDAARCVWNTRIVEYQVSAGSQGRH